MTVNTIPSLSSLLLVVVAFTWTSCQLVSGFTWNPNVVGIKGQTNTNTNKNLSLPLAFSSLFAHEPHDNHDESSSLSSSSSSQRQTQQSRRGVMATFLSTATTTIAFTASASEDNGDGGVSLLEQFGTDPNKITQKSNNDAANRGAPVVAKPKTESMIEPNLRSNYYYPTNKKRYLPRIKKCNDAIPDAAEAIGTGNWDVAEEFVNKIADDTILPLKLYTSSLTGGGTNVKVSFTKDMFKAADDFEKAQKELIKAVKKRDQKASSKALEELSTALSAYRVAGKLTGPDAGGDIPSVDEIRRSACRVQGRTFEQKVKARDARLAEAMAAAAKEN
mmetsp:Transcript_5532/g.10523  ORF Transcript_5532/g.10523 Transcript_5532/m.10523 type:complete len:333 (-) Transcript_5532:46-1044(-)